MGVFTSASLASGGGGGSSFTAAGISGSWRGALSGSLDMISGSSTSTGSFGSLYVDNRIGLGITNPQAYDTGINS